MDIFEALFSASQARVLLFLARNSGKAFFEREIVDAANVSRSAVNMAARALHENGLIHRERRGRMNFYRVNEIHPFILQFKKLDTLASIEPMLAELRPLSRQIILFGSRADGTNVETSDIDLFILSAEREKVMKIIGRYGMKLPIQAVVMNNQELVEMKEKDAAFHAQVKRGMTLWEANNELGT
jgi:predicted nucleotidyltransferase